MNGRQRRCFFFPGPHIPPGQYQVSTDIIATYSLWKESWCSISPRPILYGKYVCAIAPNSCWRVLKFHYLFVFVLQSCFF